MSSKVIILCIFVFANLVNPVQSSESLGYKPSEIIVRFAPRADGVQTSIAERNAILVSLGGGEVKQTYKLVPGLSLVKLPAGISVKDAVAMFNKAKGILYAEPNYRRRALSTFPNDLRFNELWGMHNIGQTGGTLDADIDAPEAWDIATDSDVIVAVIDSGVDYNHPDLAENMWINPGEDYPPLGVVGPEDFNGVNDDGNIDANGNPLIDDIYGYDFCTFQDKQRDSDPMDEFLHGTHCAGIIGGLGNNNEGVTGVCWNVKIMALKIMPPYYLSDTVDIVYVSAGRSGLHSLAVDSDVDIKCKLS